MWEAGTPIEGGNDTGIPDVKYFNYLKSSYDDEHYPSSSAMDFDYPQEKTTLTYDELISKAKMLFVQKDYARSLDYYNQALERSYDGVDALCGKAECLIKMGENKQASEIYYRIAYMNTWGDSDKELAIKYYKKSLALDSTNEETLGNLAYSLRMTGRYSEALTYFKRIKHENVDWKMAMCYMGMKEYGKAIPLLDKVIADCPFCDDHLDEKCECLIKLGRKDEAIILYKNFIDFLMDNECYERAIKRIDLLSKIVSNDSFVNDRKEKSLIMKERLEMRFKSILNVMSKYHMHNPNGLDENDLYGFIKFVCEESGESVEDIVRWYNTPMLGSSSFSAICGRVLHYSHWGKITKMYKDGKFKDL